MKYFILGTDRQQEFSKQNNLKQDFKIKEDHHLKIDEKEYRWSDFLKSLQTIPLRWQDFTTLLTYCPE